MKALIVYESMFGSTRSIGEAIAAGMRDAMDEVEIIAVQAAPSVLPADVDLLVVGGPTHAFGLSRSSTRRTARQWRGSTVTPVECGLREWLTRLAPVGRPVNAATFDTKVRRPPAMGSAARVALRALRAKGCHPIGHHTSWVRGTLGPLSGGELERAREWGANVARRAVRAATASA